MFELFNLVHKMATVMLHSVNNLILCRHILIKKVKVIIFDTICFKNSLYEFGST